MFKIGMHWIALLLIAVAAPALANHRVQEFSVEPGAHPHDVAPAPDGTVWYTAQRQGALGRLDPATGRTHQVPLGKGSSPHGVIVGPDGAAWVTDSGQNAIVRVDGASEAVRVFPLPPNTPYGNLNTAAFDGAGRLWFTGQAGLYGRLDPASGKVDVWNAPRGFGPYGIHATPDGTVYYVSLAGSYLARIDGATGQAHVIDPPTAGAGTRRVWSDSKGRLWVSQWNAGQLAVYDPVTEEWREWKVPGQRPAAYAVYVDERDTPWLSDFGSNSIVSFNERTETFTFYRVPTDGAAVRQMLGRRGEVWGAASGTDKLVLIRMQD